VIGFDALNQMREVQNSKVASYIKKDEDEKKE
jgi:hypothetical protein